MDIQNANGSENKKIIDKQSSKRRNFVRSGFVRDCDSKRIDGIQVYKAKLSVGVGDSVSNRSNSSKGRDWKGRLWSSIGSLRLYNAIFFMLYLFQGFAVLKSSGVPYREFLLKADIEGFQVMQGSARIRAELEHSFRDLNDPKRRTSKIGWTDWMDMDIEELVEEKKRDKERNVLDSLPKHMRVPGKFQTSFWPTLLLGCLATFHAFILLLQYWSVKFNILMNYEEVNVDSAVEYMKRTMPIDLDLANISTNDDNSYEKNAKSAVPETQTEASKGNKTGKFQLDSSGNRIVFPDREITVIPARLPTHARVIPSKLGEKDVLVPIQYLPTLGMCIEYHRRRYVYNATEQTWSKIRCRTDFHLSFLRTWKGFSALSQTVAGQIRFGPNLFRVKQPSFIELYKAQLLNPFAVFQIFCVLLWAIDDYLIFSFFSLFMVFMFEGTVVFQRIKSLQALQGMGNPSRNIYVYRQNNWTIVDSAEILPGDVISLTLVKPHRAKTLETKDSNRDAKNANDKESEPQKKHATKRSNAIQDEGGDIVPADLLILRGSTVVNEASLTGESVPQMKEGLSELENCTLSMKHQHKMNVVYAGTKMLQCQGSQTPENGTKLESDTGKSSSSQTQSVLFNQIPLPPDGGCTCFVLRTGFASAQGKLVRMIEGSQEKVKGHEYETGLLLGMLCIFAIISSSYVLYHGMKNANRSKYELLLHCIMIVTNVIRPELPMQMAMAVNTSILTLLKLHVYCTEPYRVPVAGKLTACLFDKTGTLTTDELVAVGVCEPSKVERLMSARDKSKENDGKSSIDNTKDDDIDDLFTSMSKLNKSEAALVLAGCQSLVVYDDETMGDPLESAALKSMKWHISLKSGCAEPMPAVSETRPGGKPIVLDNGKTSINEVSVITRHHFSSKLQRMSCVIRAGVKKYAVAKGSPEAVGNMLASKPAGYDKASEMLSKLGYRVIALAYRVLESIDDCDKAIETRTICEANLNFCGFIAFTCMVRKDTADVLQRLKEGGMTVAMITGDALFTAIHVAKEVNILCKSHSGQDSNETIDPELVQNEEIRKLIEEKRGKPIQVTNKKVKKINIETSDSKPIAYLDAADSGTLFWRSYSDGSRLMDYVATDVEQLSKEYDLATTGKSLALALESDEHTSKVLGHIKIFARMTPDAKETVIESLHSVGDICLMCGDGANDVGALKQADVGVALLSGFGNVNVEKTEPDEVAKTKETKNEAPPVTAIMSQDHLNQIRALPVSLIKMKIKQLGTDPSKYPEIVEKEDLVKLYQIKAREVAIRRHDERNALAKKQMTKKEEEEERKRQALEKQRRMHERIAELEAQGVAWASFKVFKEFAAAEYEEARQKKLEIQKTRGVEGSAAALAAQLEAAMGGDGNELDEMGQPMVKLGDASIAAPFTSKMPSIRSCVDIVRQGRCTLVTSMQMYQIMALQCLISSYSLSALYFDGVKYGDTQMTALGMLGTVLHLSISRSKPLDKLSRVQPISSIFHPASILSLLGQFVVHLVTMILAVQAAKKHLPPDWEVDLDGHFKPGILNTSVFLISSVQQVTVFVVNLQGPPFMTGVLQNRPLLWTLIGTFILTFMFASESVPGLNRYFQLVPFPDDGYRDYILLILSIDLIATFFFDRTMKFIFARDIFKAGLEGTTRKDIISLLQTFAIIGFLMYQFLGNSEAWDTIIAMQEEIALNATRLLDEDNDDVRIVDTKDTVVQTLADSRGSLAVGIDEF